MGAIKGRKAHGGHSMANVKRKASKLVIVREPNGRLSRSTAEKVEACSPAEVRRLRDAAVRGARGEEWGTELGRLFLDGKLSAPLFETGKRWARLAKAVRDVIGAPGYPRVTGFVEKSFGHDADPDSKEGQRIADRDRMLVQEMTEAHGALIGAGMLAEQAVRWVCEDDKAVESYPQQIALERGLTWVATFWGLLNAPKHVR
jgi:hypothetical protein